MSIRGSVHIVHNHPKNERTVSSRVAFPLFGGVLCHTGREVSDHVATDDQHPMARKMTATHVCAAACLDSTIRVEAMGGQSTQVSQRGTTGRPGQTDSAAHTRWARQAQPSVRQPAVRPLGPPPTCVSRLQALLRYNAVPQGARPPACWCALPCTAAEGVHSDALVANRHHHGSHTQEASHADPPHAPRRRARHRSHPASPHEPCHRVPARHAGDLRGAGGRLRLPYTHSRRPDTFSFLCGPHLHPGACVTGRDGGAP